MEDINDYDSIKFDSGAIHIQTSIEGASFAITRDSLVAGKYNDKDAEFLIAMFRDIADAIEFRLEINRSH